MSLLEKLEAELAGKTPGELSEISRLVQEGLDKQNLAWTPNDGPQTDAYFSEADIVLYGGSGGGGKSDLLLGLAFNEHQKSLILRRQYTDLQPLTDRAIEINGGRQGYNGSSPPRLTVSDGKTVDFGAAKDMSALDTWQGKARDLLGIDEVAQFPGEVVRMLMGWVRSVDPEQRCRVVLCSNPPLSEEGAWLMQMFRPWLDPTHGDPAKPGELRWYIMDEDSRDLEVPGPGAYVFDRDGIPVATDLDPMGQDVFEAMSRTFIPAKLQDNPYLANSGYKRTLDNLPEPLRSAIRDGNFHGARQDHELQLIPSEWIQAAMDRWVPEPPKGRPMCSVGVDVAQGGADQTVLSPRHDSWFAPLIVEPGKNTPLGRDVAGLVMTHRTNQADVILDGGGGYAGAAYEQLKINASNVYLHKGAAGSKARTKRGGLKFFNRRAEVFYRFYEALDPSQPGGSQIMLPPDPHLAAELAMIRLDSDDAAVIKLETKKKLVERMGVSPDRADAVVISWSKGAKTASHYRVWENARGAPGEKPRHKTMPRKLGRDFTRR